MTQGIRPQAIICNDNICNLNSICCIRIFRQARYSINQDNRRRLITIGNLYRYSNFIIRRASHRRIIDANHDIDLGMRFVIQDIAFV